MPFLDALFVASSAISTTGLSVVDIGTAYTTFGQVVIFLLFQIGGLGYMTFFALFVIILQHKLSYRSGGTIQEALSAPTRSEVIGHVKRIVLFTIGFELLGAMALSFYWLGSFSLARALYMGLFHSVSAFCTAGFALFPNSFEPFRDDLTINLIISTLSVLGGIGFLVLTDIQTYSHKLLRGVRPRRLLVHSKLALVTFAALSLTGTAVIFFSEGYLTRGPLGEGLLTAAFQSLSATTTTGFYTMNIGAITVTSLFTIIILMFIGAPAGGTGGGIKTATFATILLFARSMLYGERDVSVFRRRIPSGTVKRMVGIGTIATLWVLLVTGILTVFENQRLSDLLF
jgi:trk system potassium uptake protein TrkH